MSRAARLSSTCLCKVTAVRAITPERERRTNRPESVTLYVPEPSPEMRYFARCFAYAYITSPSGPAAVADPAASIRGAIHAVLPGLQFELQSPACHGADSSVRFRTPDDREAAMEKQPFALLDVDGTGVSVKLVREGETSNVRRIRLDYLTHVALLGYPEDQRNEEDIHRNCSQSGHLREVDPACFAAPDLSPVHAVVNL